MTVSLPYEAGRPVFASLQRTADDLAALSRLPDRGAGAAGLVRRGRRSPTWPTRSSRRQTPRPRRSTGPCAFSRQRARGGRSSSWATRSSALLRSGRPAPRRSRSCARAWSATGRRSRPPSARSASPMRSRAGVSLAEDRLRARSHGAPPLRMARRVPARSLLVLPLSLLGPGSAPGRLRRGAAARPRRLGRRAGGGGGAQGARPSDSLPGRACGLPMTPAPRCRRSRGRCCAPRTGSSLRPTAPDTAARPPRLRVGG